MNAINAINAKTGFTLLELIIILFMMGLFIGLASQASTDKTNQRKYERTIESMQEIKKAILGTRSQRVRGDIKFAGYVEDMGDLPELIDGQPRGLWTRDVYNTPEDEDDDLPRRNPYSPCDIACFDTSTAKIIEAGKVQAIFLGWNGPYLKPPRDGVLKDGWKNLFIFKRKGNDFIIKSLGADGKEGGKGFNGDITFIIRESDWLAPLAGYISPYIVYHSKEDIETIGLMPANFDLSVRACIYYGALPGYQPELRDISCGIAGGTQTLVRDVTDKNATYQKCINIDEDGYFYFEKVPVGTERMLAIIQGPILQPYKVDIEPGINWMGNMGSCP